MYIIYHSVRVFFMFLYAYIRATVVTIPHGCHVIEVYQTAAGSLCFMSYIWYLLYCLCSEIAATAQDFKISRPHLQRHQT